MSVEGIGRRRFLVGAAALTALAHSRSSAARGRTLPAGRLSLRLPFATAAMDPHRLDDPLAAVLGEALFDTLYVRDDAGNHLPGLAESDPEPEGSGLRIRLRSGLRTARGRPLEPRDAAASIARARGLGARAWLADVPVPKADATSLLFPSRDAARLVRALASPLVAILPSTFAPETPDGTGPFQFTTRGDGIVLTRNPAAARGPAFLDEIVVRSAPDLAASLRSFEGGVDDLGWLGSGLHEPRAGSRPFDLGTAGYAVLFTGRDADKWDAPGVAQRLCDGIAPSRLSHLGVGPAWTSDAPLAWGGPPASIVVREDAPWLVEVARAIAATVSQPGHELTVRPVSPSDLAQRRASRTYALALDLVRTVAPGSFGAMIALATADNAGRAADLVTHPPKLGEIPARTTTRTLRAGIVGEFRVQGGRAADVNLVASATGYGIDWGASTRTRK